MESGSEDMFVTVWAYTTGDSVELSLNGKSQGKKYLPVEPTSPNSSSSRPVKCRHVEWDVTYAPGNLSAIAYLNETDAGVVSDLSPILSETKHAETYIETTGDPHGIRLSTDFDGGCVVLVRAEVVDESGRMVPVANNTIIFEFEKNGEEGAHAGGIIGLGNGDPSCHEHDKPENSTYGIRSAFNGLARAILQVETVTSGGSPVRSGPYTLTASSQKLHSDTLLVYPKNGC